MQLKYIAAILATATFQGVLSAPVPDAKALNVVDNGIEARNEQIDVPFFDNVDDLDRREASEGLERRAVQAAQAAQAAQAIQIQQAPQQNQAGLWGWPNVGYGRRVWADQLYNQRLLWNNNLLWRNQFVQLYPRVNWNLAYWQRHGLYRNNAFVQRWW